MSVFNMPPKKNVNAEKESALDSGDSSRTSDSFDDCLKKAGFNERSVATLQVNNFCSMDSMQLLI